METPILKNVIFLSTQGIFRKIVQILGYKRNFNSSKESFIKNTPLTEIQYYQKALKNI
jgi:hypothetical protein